MKPESYLLDLDPSQSNAIGKTDAVQCKHCGAAIERDNSSFFVSSECDDCQSAMDGALETKMQETGHAGGWPLYWGGGRGAVGTFHGKRKWRVAHVSTGYHNIARRQYRLYWRMPDGKEWTGTVFGDNTQLVRGARVLKRQS